MQAMDVYSNLRNLLIWISGAFVVGFFINSEKQTFFFKLKRGRFPFQGDFFFSC